MSMALLADAHTDDRRQETLDALQYVVQYCRDNGVRQLVFLGDLNDRRKQVHTGVLHRLAEIFELAGQEPGPLEIYLLPGNHDYESDVEASRHSMRILAGYSHVHVACRPFSVVEVLGTPFTCVLMPFEPSAAALKLALASLKTDKGQLVKLPFAGEPPATAENTVAATTKSIIVCGHQLVQGATINGLETETEVQAKWYKPFRRAFLGDVHDRQQVGPVQYIGAPIQHNFGDAGKDRGFAIYDPGTDALQFLPIPAPRYHNIDFRASAHNMIVQEVIKQKVGPGDFVKLRPAGTPDELNSPELSAERQNLEKQGLRVISEPRPEVAMPLRLDIEPGKLFDLPAVVAAYVQQANTTLDRDSLLKLGLECLPDHELEGAGGITYQFDELTLTNFGSFEYAKFNFPTGLLSITGRNLDEGGSNGSGKSVLLSALPVCLHGESEQDVTADDWIRRGAPAYGLALKLHDNLGNAYEIRRSRFRKPKGAAEAVLLRNGVEIENKIPAVNATVAALLRMDRRLFGHVVFMSQEGNQSFADAGDAERREILTAILPGVEQLDAALKRAKTLKSQGDVACDAITGELISARAAHTELSAHDYDADIARFEAERTAARAVIGEAIVSLQDVNLRLEAQLANMVPPPEFAHADEITALQQRIHIGRTQHQQLGSQWTTYQATTSSKITLLDARVRELQEKAHQARTHSSGVCDQCGQDITPASAESFAARWDAEAAALTTKRPELIARIENAKQQLVVLVGVDAEILGQEEELARLRRGQQDALYASREFKANITRMQQQVADGRSRIEDKKQEDQRIAGQTNTFEAMKAERTQRLKALEDQQTAAMERQRAAQQALALVEFWVAGFGSRGVRSFMFDNFVSSLTDQINQLIGDLFDGVYVTISTTKATAAGDLREKLDLQVWLDGERVALNRFSGGEKRLIRLAVNLALAFAAQERLRVHLGLLIMDEAFENLDSWRVQKVGAALMKLTYRIPSIYIVTHLSALQDVVTQELVVTKQGRISRLGVVA